MSSCVVLAFTPDLIHEAGSEDGPTIYAPLHDLRSLILLFGIRP
jgi:hypothetical protein